MAVEQLPLDDTAGGEVLACCVKAECAQQNVGHDTHRAVSAAGDTHGDAPEAAVREIKRLKIWCGKRS